MTVLDTPTAPLERLPRPDLSHIPGPRTLPFLGKTISFGMNPYGTYFDQVARFGNVFRMTVFGDTWVVLAGPDALAEVYLNREAIYSAQHGLKAFAPIFSGGLLHRDDLDHRAHRRVMQAAFRAPVLKNYLTLMNGEIARLLDKWPNNSKMQFAPAVKELTLRLGAHVFMGVTDQAEVGRINAAFIDEVAATSALVRKPIPFTKMGKGVAARKALSDDFRRLIAARKVNGGDDFFSQLCIAEDEDGQVWSDQDIIDHFNFLLVAAHDAVTGAVTTMVWALAQDKYLQEGVRAEILRLGTGPLAYEDLDKLDLTDRVYREALRRFTPSAFTARAVMADTEWERHRLPRGTNVVICPGPVMMTPELFPEPERFDPDRYLPDRAEDQQHKFAWSPFGGGAHKCIGMHFASIQVKAFMVQLLQRFSLEMDVADRPKWREIPTPLPTNGLPVTLRLRQSAQKTP
ncbi:Cytochrome P450 [Cognatiyoonia koreensis]|uniref:Cytochrome P450 n=1 Tax=Cognatiyoonia koreensis TaxID=364200 RepID=A0A1I0PW15_9RHOB|nr:cytochrome P450 [Cognatiyoonia koreensis]SEW18649.1 Cytochrome P450 [Cognatiyoonia koreensis]